MSKIPAINEIDANSPSQESTEVVVKATTVTPDINEIQETISASATIQEIDGTRKPTISEIYKIVNDGLFESTTNWWDYAYKLSQAQLNQDIISRLDNGVIGGGYSKGVDIITTTSNKVPSNTNVYSALKSDSLYPKKLNDEVINGIYDFLNGLTIGKPTAYTGGNWSVDQMGKTHLTTDYLYVRLKAIFETLQILNVDTIGGKLVISPAGSIRVAYVDRIKIDAPVFKHDETTDVWSISQVEDEEGNLVNETLNQEVYRCYFLGEQDGEEIDNKWKVGDQAQAKTFNVKKGTYHKVENSYLWRLVVNVSSDTVDIDGKKYHYVDLSQIDFDSGSDAPAPGDVLNQLGHRLNDTQRQTALVLNAVDNYAPSITLYAGINYYTLLNKEYVEFGVYNGKAFFNVYGDMYIGDKGENPKTYIKYKNGKINIKANLEIGSSIGDKDLDQYIKENGGVDEETVNNLINNSQVIKNLQKQTDGKAETWYQVDDPSTDWTDKASHEGDIWYNTSNGTTNYWNGSAWEQMDIPKDVFDTIDGKSSIFVDSYVDAKAGTGVISKGYKERDLWIIPEDATVNGVKYYKGDMLTAVSKNTNFDETNWKKKVRYVGPTELNNAIDVVNEKINTINNITIPGINNKFNEFIEDGVLDSSEKARLTDLLNQASNEVAAVIDQVNNITTSKYLTNDNANKGKLEEANTVMKTAWTEYKNLINTLIAANTEITKVNIGEANTKYRNLQEKIKTVKQYLAICQADILSGMGTDITSYKYLKDALNQTTEINGGLVLTSAIQLKDVDKKVTAGMNGIVKGDKTSIAAWYGGPMVDRDTFTSEELETKIPGTDYAMSLLRHDGTGYLAGGNIHWNANGVLSGNFNSFILQGTSMVTMFYYIRLFYLHTANQDSTDFNNIDYVTPMKTFSRLSVLPLGGVEGGNNLPTGLFIGDSNTGGSFQIGNIILRTKSGDPNILEIVSASSNKTAHLGVQGGVSAYGTYTPSTGGGGGLNATVVSYANILKGNYVDTDLTRIPNAYSVKALSNRIDNIATELDGLNLSWNNITDKPTTFTPSAHNHKWIDITDRITNVSQLTNDVGYLTTHQSLANYYTKAEIDAKGYTTNKGTVTSVGLTLPTGLTCAINNITTSGTFAVTFASGYSIPTTTKQSSWDSAVSVKHSHSNKTVLDGITSTKVTNWDSAYRWYSLITTDEETADGIINKWNEVVNFLANIAQTDTLSGIIDGINTSISNEVSRAKKAEGTNASNISANKTSITTLQGYFTSGSAKKALQLTTARNLWGNAFNGTADVNGSIVLPSDKYISIGNIKLEYDATNKALKITNTTTDEVANLYASGGVSAYGVGSVSGSGGGGLNGTIVPYSTAIASDPQNEGSKIASASSIYKLHSRISNIENNGATSITVTGTGNAITSVSKNGTSITFTKGATFLTSHQSLANYVTIDDSRLSDSRYPKFANNTWYLVGDDVYIGDHNNAGIFCIKSANSDNVSGIALYNSNETAAARLWFDNTSLKLDEQLVMNNKRIWIQGVGTAGGNNNRLTLVAGMPSGLAFNTSCRGTILYSNGIAFADPYNGNSNTDSGWIRHLETTSNVGTLEIAVGDDASNEQIHFRWYNTNSSAETIAHDITVPRATGTLALTSQIPTTLPANGGNADTVDNEHASNFSYTHQSSFDFSKGKSGRIVTFDQSNTDYGWINGFASTYNDYLTSVIFNTHRTSNWYVGYIESHSGITKGLLAVKQLAFLDSKVADSDKLDGIHANGLLTALSNSNNGISITVGGTTKSISNINVNHASNADTALKVFGQVGDTGSHELVRCDMSSDQFRIIAGSSGNNKGWAEIATADDGNEPIYVRQYSGVFSSVVRTLTLLDANGYTHFPSYINIGGNENNNSSPDRVWGSNGSDSYLRSYRTSALNVNYAASAGNADAVDGEHLIKNGSGTGIKQVYYFSSKGNNPSYIKLGTLNTVSATGYSTSKVMFTVKGGINFGGTNESVYEVAASTRGSIQVTSTLVRGNRELKFGYVSTSSNVEIWMAYDGTYRGVTEVEVSSSVDFTLTMTETTTKPSGFVEGSYRILAATADNVASATKLQTPRTIWGQNFDGTGNVDGTLTITNSGSDDPHIISTVSKWFHIVSKYKLVLYAGEYNSSQTDAINILSNHNVGIGVDPSYKLHVAGNIYASDTIIGESNKIGLTIRGPLNATWSSWFAHETSGNEALVIATQNPATTIMLTNGESYANISSDRYTSMTPALTIEHNQVMINRPYSSSGCGYNFYVNGTSNFNGKVQVNNMLISRAIMFTNTDVNGFGTDINNWDGSIGANVTNMFNGIEHNNISLEYSANGGSSWTTYTDNPNYLFNLINDNSDTENFYLGNNVMSGSSDADKLTQIKKNQLRVTIKIPPEVYQELAWISVDVNNGVNIKCQVYFGNSSGVYTEHVSKVLTGWSHRCDICIGPLNINIGNDSYRYVRLVFSHLSSHTSLCNGIVSRIRALALTKYNNPSERYNISTTGHIYNFDYNMNTYFPNSILAKGGVTAYQSSDIRLKTNIAKLNCLNVIKSIGGTYEFDYIRDHKHSIGFIAQNVNNPLLKDIIAKDDNGYLKINYWNPKLISLAFGALTEIDDEVDKLKARVRELESEVEYLKNKDYALQ